ncbi:helix-turn-helix domain-containing protein [Candidatus Woesearchaeota archaeon]|nr:helix-turn-helix domain-containing protein [Candidatus Woesearchaeota archaeon]
MNLEILRKIGLSEGEVKVYNALLKIGETPINNIHEQIGIDRRNIYDILNKLIERGLVAYIESDGKRVFRISNPDKILSYIEEKKTNLEDIKEEIKKLVPDMQKICESKKQEFQAMTFKDKEGIKAVWDDMLHYKAIFWIGSGMYVPDKFPAFFKDWDKRRKKNKVKSYHLFRYEKRNVADKNIWHDRRFLPSEFSGNPTVIAIYGNKVVNFLFGENLFAFVIESKELAENYKEYHKYLWENVAKK